MLIKAQGRPDAVPRSTLIRAARQAARLSRQRRDSVVEVDYTLAKHVRKAPSSRPGMVFYTHQKTLAVRPEAE